MPETSRPCPVCGGSAWSDTAVIWSELSEQWGLGDDERAYIDRQQGTSCDGCGTTLRSAALAAALADGLGWREPWDRVPARLRTQTVLEINEAGTLTPRLRQWRRHRLVEYPEVDMTALPFDDASFEVVVHSDTLEHVPDPIRGLEECLRVLRPGGLLVYTIPVVVGRMSRTRAGLSPSYHGAPGEDNYLVHTEYGADFWTEPVQAGFESVGVHAFEFPAAQAVVCRRPGGGPTGRRRRRASR